MLFVFKRSDTINDTNLSYELLEIRTIGRPSHHDHWQSAIVSGGEVKETFSDWNFNLYASVNTNLFGVVVHPLAIGTTPPSSQRAGSAAAGALFSIAHQTPILIKLMRSFGCDNKPHWICMRPNERIEDGPSYELSPVTSACSSSTLLHFTSQWLMWSATLGQFVRLMTRTLKLWGP